MAAHRPPSAAAPAKPVNLEITVISAKHLKNVNWRHGDLKPYAVLYLDPDHRAATKPDDSGDTRPVWNEHVSLQVPHSVPLDDPSLALTIDIFHSKPSETPKPLVGTARIPVGDLIDPSAADHGDYSPIRTVELRRPSGRPHGKIRIKLAVRERPAPPPDPNYHAAAHHHGYYYSTAPPPPPPSARDYPRFSPPPPPPSSYNVTLPPTMPSQFPYSGYSDPYTSYYPPPQGYYSAPPDPAAASAPVHAPSHSRTYYDRVQGYGSSGPSAPADYSAGSAYYDQKVKGSKLGGMGSGLPVGTVAGTLGGLSLEEGLKHEEAREKSTRDDYSSHRGEY